MSIKRILWLFSIWLLSITGVISAGEIIVNGRCDNKGILLPANAISVEKRAAHELQYHLQEATGVKLPIVAEDSAAAAELDGGYCLGAAQRAQSWLLIDDLPPCAYKVRYRDGFLYIAGHDGQGGESNGKTAAGTLFGVTDYLMQSLGVRWVYPGKGGEYIPRVARVTVGSEQEGDYYPALRYQGARVYHLGGNIDRSARERFRWARRVMHYYVGGAYQYAGGRAGHAFTKWYHEYGASHPDWFAFVNGKRRTLPGCNMCVSNSEFQDEVVRRWWDSQKANLSRKLMINVKETDAQMRCQCPDCLAWDGDDVRGPTGRYALSRNVGERYARFYLAVQEKAAKFDPEAMVGFFAYQSYFFAPRTFKLNPRCYCELVPDVPFPRTKAHTDWLRGEYQAWKATGATFGLRPNYFLGGYCMPEIWYDEYIDEFKYLVQELNIQGLDVDGPTNMFGTQSLNLYAMGRIATNPNLTAAQIKQEYLEGFGSAAAWVKEYTDYYHSYMKEHAERINDIYLQTSRQWYLHGFEYGDYAFKIFPPESLLAGLAILDRGLAALANSDDRPAVVKLEFLRQGLEHALLTVQSGAVLMAENMDLEKREPTINKLQEYRKTLSRHLVQIANLEKSERKWGIPQKPKKAKEIIALPEKWAVQLDPEKIGEKNGYMKPDYDASSWKQLSTWKTLEKQGQHKYENAWYRVSFKLGADKQNRRASLFLGAVDESCKIWVNGKEAGELIYDAIKDPRSWEKPFEVDISKLVDFQAENVVVVKLINMTGPGGIWKPSFIAVR